MTATAAAASAASATSLPGHRFTAAFVPEPARVADLRRITSRHLRRWKVASAAAEDIVLAVSELVTNAIQHGQGDGTLTVRYCADTLHVVVADKNRAPAEIRQPREDDVSGRGLFLVDALAQNWGVSQGGTTTWCLFRLPPESRPAPERRAAEQGAVARERQAKGDAGWD